jgi:tRNA pseudouridine38-40 synthase
VSVDHKHAMLLTVAYDGTPFSGWAQQRDARTVAGELQGAIEVMDPAASPLRGVSRTDSGVHARGQLAAFDTSRPIEPRGWALGLAQQLPAEVAVTQAARFPAGFDPRAHVVGKLYRYALLCSPTRDPFWNKRAWRIDHRLNHELMQQEASSLLGEHDFAAFRGSLDQRADTVRRIVRAEVRSARSDPRCVAIEVAGNRFLYHMVRIIVGTLVDVGRGRLAPGAVARALRSGARNDLGMTAPAEGLYLERVELDQPPLAAWPGGLAAD